MKINIKAIATIVAVFILGLAGMFAYYSFQGKYTFESEPQLQQADTWLTKTQSYDRQPLQTQPLRDCLETQAQVDAYDTVAQYTFNADISRFQLYSIDNDDLQIAVSAFRGDHPEVFWLDAQSCYKYHYDGTDITVELSFTETGDDLETDRQALQNAVQEAVAAAPENADDYDIELFLNDWLCQRCTYNNESSERHTALGALVLGEAVCDGYARAFQLLCRQFGIECLPVEGTSDFAGDGEGGHMWNVVQLGDNWYHVDVTWNDAPEATCDVERYFYLNLTTDQIRQDHVISGSFSEDGAFFNIYVPVCSDDALNYMQRTFVTVKDPEEDRPMVAALLNMARRQDSFCAFLIDESADFAALTQAITETYAAEWVRGANRFLNGNHTISSSGRVVTYENKRVLAIIPEYT